MTRSTKPASLTPREREVLALIGRGLSNRAVAAALGVELGTARKHRENLMRKLNLHTTAEIVLYVHLEKKKRLGAKVAITLEPAAEPSRPLARLHRLRGRPASRN